MSRPFVSVLIDTYNHEHFIEQAIVSVLEQDVSPAEMEVIVVDDGSTDNTSAIVRKFAPRVRYLFKNNGGQASAFNAGIPEMRGEIASFLDGDDWWAPGKLRAALEQLEKFPGVGSVGHGQYEVYPDNRPCGMVVPDKIYRLHLADPASALLFAHLAGFLGTSKITIRKALLDRILPIPEELVIEADEYIFTLAPALADAIVLDRPLFYYRFHRGNLFQFAANDPVRFRRKYNVLAALLRTLPLRLAEFGVSPEVIRKMLEPRWAEAERIRLSLDGGWPWQTFRVERASYRMSYKDVGLRYRAFQAIVLGLTLALPPRTFYRLRQWYTAKGLRRLRGWAGEPASAIPVIEQRPRAELGR
ncbi:MAG: glycosyltransferase [Acidobacteria bacterium]|nr:glycosyltransferase [Acidobacteriota bacterium]